MAEAEDISMNKIVLFTDLDGTLLDEETYSADLSLSALKELQEKKIDVVFCSSKTRKEQEAIQQTLNVKDPFIVENGSAIIIPPQTINIVGKYREDSDGTKLLVLGIYVEELRTILSDITSRLGIVYQSFHDLSSEQIAQITGLGLEEAKRAKSREFSETIVTKFNSKELRNFIYACESNDLLCMFGGRFLSVIGKGADKGKAVRLLAEHYNSNFGEITTIGIGDSLNDAPMLQEVNYAYLVQRPNGQFRELDLGNLNYVRAIGPLGFAKMVEDVKQRLQI